MIWTEVEIKTTPEAEEAVTELYYAAGAQGIAVESADNLADIRDDPTINYIDEAILNINPEIVTIHGFFAQETDIDAGIALLKSGIENLPTYGINPGQYEISISTLEEEDWSESWKQYYKPTQVGKNIIIKPTWEDYDAKASDIVIDMDPGMAFGTGTHETTQLCVAAMEECIQQGDTVFDIGCGTGILSIIAVRLGCEKVIGVDLDPVAVAVAKENIVLNHTDDRIEIREGNLVDVLNPNEQADVIVANILAEAVVALTESILPFLKSGGLFISSGIITDRLEMVLDALKKQGFSVKKVDTLGDWHSVTAVLLPKEV